MDIKIKTLKAKSKPVLKPMDAGLTYRETPGLGLTAFYEGYRLFFSASRKAGLQKKAKPNSMIEDLNLYSLFSTDAKNAWTNAARLAKRSKRDIGAEDLFLALLQEPSVKKFFFRLQASAFSAEKLLKNYLKLTPPSGSRAFKKIPFEAFALSIKLHNRGVGSLMLLASLLKHAPVGGILRAIFASMDLTEEKIKIFSIWIFNLNCEFPENSNAAKLLYCCRQAGALEECFGYFFEFSAIEAAVNLSSKQSLKDLEHKKALQYLVKAGLLAKNKRVKTISEDMVGLAFR